MKLIKYKKRILIFGLAFLLLLPFNFAMGQEESELGLNMEEELNQVSEEVIKNKAIETARQIEIYLKLNPNKTIVELQADPEFEKIAVQRIADTGYTAVIDSNSGYIYFHPQEKLVNTDSHQFQESLPSMWAIFDKTIGSACREADGYYDWQEEDGTITKKYMYLACVGAAADSGQNLFVAATAYLNKQAADKYLAEYSIKKSFLYAKDAIRQKAEDVARQIEIYIKLNPDKTVKDLQADEYFQEIAVQIVGQTGYTAVTDYETLTCRFHSNPTIVDMDLHDLAEKLPGFWGVMSKTAGGVEAEGIYDWEEADGTIKQKYMYISIVNAKTADGVELSVAATTYLDEYEESEKIQDEAGLSHSEHYTGDQNSLLHLAQDEARKIEIITSGFSRDIKALSQTAGIKHLLGQVSEDGVLTDAEAEKNYYPKDKELYWQNVQEYFLRIYAQNSDEIDAVRLFHKNGYVVNGVVLGEEDTNDYKGDKSWFKDVMDPEITENGEVYISPISLARRTNSPAIRYVMPVDVDGERLGLIIINFKASAVYSVLDNENNILFLDKAYENAEGEINTDWVVTLADPRKQEQILDEGKEAASVIRLDQLIGDNGFLEFTENGKMQVGAYQKVNVSDQEWYTVVFVNKGELQTKPASTVNVNQQAVAIGYVGYIFWFFGALMIIFLVTALLYYFKIIKLERVTLLIMLVVIFLLISGMFIFGSYSTVKDLKSYFKNSYIDQHLQLEMLLSEKISELIGDLNAELKYLVNTSVSENFDEESHTNLLKAAYERNKDFVYAVYRIDKDDIIREMYSVDETSLEADLSEQEYMKKVREIQKPVLSDIFDAVEGFQGVTLHYPIIKNNEYDGTVAFLINIDEFLDILSLFSKHIHSHESFLLDKNGQVITSDIKDYIGKNIFEIAKYKTVKSNYENILNSKEIGFEEFILEGKKQICTYAPIEIEDNTWIMAINGEEKDAYQGIDNTFNSIWLFTFLALVLFVIMSWLLNYFLTKILRQEVDIKTKEIKEKAIQIEVQLKKEEKISQEKEGLLKEQKRIKIVLENKVEEMEKFQKLTVGRELKMIELKEKIKKISKNN